MTAREQDVEAQPASGLEIVSITPEPTDAERAAIVSAIEGLHSKIWPHLGAATMPEPSPAWRYAGKIPPREVWIERSMDRRSTVGSFSQILRLESLDGERSALETPDPLRRLGLRARHEHRRLRRGEQLGQAVQVLMARDGLHAEGAQVRRRPLDVDQSRVAVLEARRQGH